MSLLEFAHELHAQARREARDTDDPALTAELERGEEQRSPTDEHRPLRHCGAVGGEVLWIARGILDPDDALVARELLQERLLQREVRPLRSVLFPYPKL